MQAAGVPGVAARTWRARRSAIGTDESAPVGGGDDRRVERQRQLDARLVPGRSAVLAPMFNIGVGEVILGGVGSGLYGMIFYVVIAVFIGGLMVGRTPEYLGKKIGARRGEALGDRASSCRSWSCSRSPRWRS